MAERAATYRPKSPKEGRYLYRVGGELDTVATGVVDIHGVARAIAVHPDVLHLDALCFQLLHHGIGLPRALEVEGVVRHTRSGAVLGVKEAQAGAAELEPYYVGA